MTIKQIIGGIVGISIGTIAYAGINQFWLNSGGITPDHLEALEVHQIQDQMYMVDHYTMALTLLALTSLFGLAGVAFMTDKVPTAKET